VEEKNQPPNDQDPAALQHVDAERVTGKEADGGSDHERPEDQNTDLEDDAA